MFGPGEYRPDPTEGITCVEDLPQAVVQVHDHNAKHHICCQCGHSAYRDKLQQRLLHDLGDLRIGRPQDLRIIDAQYDCTPCGRYFSTDLSDLAPPKSHYTHPVIETAVRIGVEDGLPYRAASWHLWRDHRVFVPFATIQNGVEAAGQKAESRMGSAFLNGALANFSGYIAVDELYDGPFCVLSAVDKRRDKRILYEVLDHNPNHDDIRAFLRRLKTALEVRGLTLSGVTTDGSSLYPEPLHEVFGDVPHQICQFHVIKDVVKAVLKTVSSQRQALSAKKPKLPRGRPSTKAARQAVRKKKRLEHKSADLFKHRHLFVKRHLSPRERKLFLYITRGLPQLRKLRELMEQVDALFDRRCRTQSGLDKLAKLRQRLGRFKHLGECLKKRFSPTLEKALTFLDDKLLPSTSNAVERGNRRYRKMQKSIYRVRTYAQIKARIALDMWREAQGKGRDQTLEALHEARAGCP